MKRIFLLLVLGISTFAQGRRFTEGEFELKGDVLGESLADFKMHHSQASCKSDGNRDICVDHEATFAEHQPFKFVQTDSDAGLKATFFHGKLKQIHYQVEKSGIDVFTLFTKKFGKPDNFADYGDTKWALWIRRSSREDFQQLMVHVGMGTIVSLIYMGDPANNDI